jgi:hypothetical protein
MFSLRTSVAFNWKLRHSKKLGAFGVLEPADAGGREKIKS